MNVFAIKPNAISELSHRYPGEGRPSVSRLDFIAVSKHVRRYQIPTNRFRDDVDLLSHIEIQNTDEKSAEWFTANHLNA